MPTGEISPETVVVIAEPDGSLPGGMTQADLMIMVTEQRAKSTSGQAATDETRLLSAQPAVSKNKGDVGFSTMGTRSWTAGYGWTQFQGSSQIGLYDDTRMNYSFSVTPGTVQWAEGQGLGYYRGYNGGSFGTWSAFYSLGTAKSHASGGASVPWGNAIGITQFRVRSLNSPIAGGFWGP